MLYYLKKLLTAIQLFALLTIIVPDHIVQGTAIKLNKVSYKYYLLYTFILVYFSQISYNLSTIFHSLGFNFKFIF